MTTLPEATRADSVAEALRELLDGASEQRHRPDLWARARAALAREQRLAPLRLRLSEALGALARAARQRENARVAYAEGLTPHADRWRAPEDARDALDSAVSGVLVANGALVEAEEEP